MRLPKCYFWGQVVGSVHKLLATNNVHRNVIIRLTYSLTYTNVQEQMCAVYVIDTAWIYD